MDTSTDTKNDIQMDTRMDNLIGTLTDPQIDTPTIRHQYRYPDKYNSMDTDTNTQKETRRHL